MNRNRAGFSLVEVLAAVVLLGLLFTVVLKVSNQGLLFALEAMEQSDSGTNVLTAIRELEKEIRASEAILLPAPGEAGTVLLLKQGPYLADRLEFYYRANSPDRLWRNKNNGHNPVAYGIEQVSFFVSETGKTVEIHITVPQATKSYRTAVSLRR